MSGATARFDIVNFPPTADEHLINFLQTIVVDEAKEVSVVVGVFGGVGWRIGEYHGEVENRGK